MKKPIICLPKDHYENLEKFYVNFDSAKKFMELIFTPDEYDCWLYQNQYIKDTYFGDKPICKIKPKKYSSRITIVDDIENNKHKVNEKHIQKYMKIINKRIKKGETK